MILRKTRSICPVCMKTIDADIVEKGAEVYLEKTCPDHGSTSTVIWRGNDPDWADWNSEPTPYLPPAFQTEEIKGCPYDCGLCDEHKAQTCSVLCEVTERCNLGCPVCFAMSEIKERKDVGIEKLREMFQTVIDAGGPYPLQLSGGEPTVRDDLPEIIRMARDMGFAHIQINTNGLRIAQDKEYLKALKDAGADLIYLQLDGVSDEVYKVIRGRELAAVKKKALENCRELEIGVQLVPVIIRGVNDSEIGDIVRLAKEFMPVVRGIHFQPVSYFGRYEIAPDNNNRATLPEVLHAMEEQTDGEIKASDFLPRRKHDAHCGFSGFYILKDGKLISTMHFDPNRRYKHTDDKSPAEHVREFMTNHSKYFVQLEPGECECMTAVRMSQAMNKAKKYSLSISGMPFMDAWTMDIERVKNCCIHVIRQDGRLVPFCANYVTNMDGKTIDDLFGKSDIHRRSEK